jgi:hypothetical protein
MELFSQEINGACTVLKACEWGYYLKYVLVPVSEPFYLGPHKRMGGR